MSIFTRKKEVRGEIRLPELPKLPELSSLSSEMESSELERAEEFSIVPRTRMERIGPPRPSFEHDELKKLPPLPSSEISEDFSQSAVKFVITPQKKPEERKLTLELPTIEQDLPRITPLAPLRMAPLRMPSPLRMESRMQEVPVTSESFAKPSEKIEPIYVRLDKFKSAIKDFQIVQAKITEIENLLKEIREQKRKEDEELKGWEREIETIKIRMEAIEQNVFSKVV